MQDINIKRINVCLDKIGNDHLTLAAYKFADKCKENGIDIIFCVLDKSYSKYSKDYCFFDMADKYSDSGIYIATSIKTANFLNKMCGKNINIFYLWELEWLKEQNFIFENYIDKYLLDNFYYWNRSIEHQKIFEHIWKIESAIIDDFDFEKIINLLNFEIYKKENNHGE